MNWILGHCKTANILLLIDFYEQIVNIFIKLFMKINIRDLKNENIYD